MTVHTLTARRSIHADPHTIASIITNISDLADWNPALLRTETSDEIARLDHPYEVQTRIPGRATLTYVQASHRRIVWRLNVIGGIETGEWNLEQHGSVTSVVHTMTHSGPLFTLMHNAMSQVPEWRLDRLQDRAQRRSQSEKRQ